MTPEEHKAELEEIRKDMDAIQDLLAQLTRMLETQGQVIDELKKRVAEDRSYPRES